MFCSTENERNRRRDLIRTLETKRENLVQQIARDGGNRARLFTSGESSSGPPRETNTTARLDNQELLQMQNRIMKDQDEELGHIEKSVKTTKVKILFSSNFKNSISSMLLGPLTRS